MSFPSDDTRPRLASLFRLQFEKAQDSWVLLYPEGMVQLNLPAAEILKRCDGQRSIGDVIAELQRDFAQPDLRADVTSFMTHAYEKGWLV